MCDLQIIRRQFFFTIIFYQSHDSMDHVIAILHHPSFQIFFFYSKLNYIHKSMYISMMQSLYVNVSQNKIQSVFDSAQDNVLRLKLCPFQVRNHNHPLLLPFAACMAVS